MKNDITIFFFVSVISSTALALKLTCRYKTETDWWTKKDVYFCDLKYGVETLKPQDVITAVNGYHLEDKSNADVVGFRANKKPLAYFPKGLRNYFDAEKIEFIAVWETGLKEIHQSDLSPFTKLRILSLWVNDVEVIERDLLKFNPHLEYIGLGKNKIKFVDGNVFGHLNALHSLYIDDNKCISTQVTDNREAVVDLLQEIQEKCSGSNGRAPGADSNFELTCRYETETDWWAINNVYFCDLQYGVETLKLKDVITAVNGYHLDDKCNADVVGFRANKKPLAYFPKGLRNYFDAEKIEFIAVWKTGLKEIHQSDLSPFTKLRILSLWVNDVEVIERDLLKFNPYLEYIGLGKNKIKFVDGNVFGHLNALHSLYIDDNMCISRQVADNREAVVDLLQEIQQKCSGSYGTAPAGDSNFEITCRFETETDWWAINNVYFCDLQYGVETLKLKDVITAVNGDHLDDRSNADVVGFRASKRRLEYFPKGLANYFDAEKIEFIAVWETGLKVIHQSDLSPFTKLRILSLWINDVEVIERDLLKFNPHLEYIGLGKNKIKFVDGNVFGHLNALHSLYIDDNKCISRQVADNREAVVDLLQEIQQKCSGSYGTAPGGDSNFEITCRYVTETDWWAINNVYFCDLQYGVETLKLKDVITAVNGDHLYDRSNADVVGFRASKRRLEYFPKGLANYFDAEKIEFIAVWETGLKVIHQSDLSPFTKLRILSLWINDVEVIERDLLKFNPHLEYIGLGKNKIKFVDGNVFGHLNALHSLYIDDNKCISRQVADNREAVVDLLQEIQQKCSGSNGTAPGGDSNLELTCRYDTETDWWAIDDVYFCDLQYGVETLKLKDVITAVNGDHLDDKSNADVAGFRASKRRLEYFPKGLANYFDAEKIEFIAVWETGLKVIHQSDLSPFTELRILSLWINDVEVIEHDLLKFNPHLEYIGLGKNKIKFVDGNVFGHLNALHSLYIDDNMCISRQVADNREAVVDLLQEIQQKCSGYNGTAPADDSNFEITCRYETETDWWAINNVYFCDLQYGVETLKLKDVITAVNGDHLDDRSNADVVGFRASKRRLQYFPKGLANYFDADKIEFIAVWETGLKEIHQSDLSPFTKLRILSLWINDVEVIERDLLKFNPHLEYIGLGKNKIKFVDGNVFGHLNALHSLYIDDNKCISRQVADNREAVVDLLQEIQQKCSGSNGTAPGGDSNLELTCRYDTETDWWAIDDVYFCDLQYGVETLKLKDVVTAVNGDHLDDKSYGDVAGFRASKRRLEYFPKGLANYFDAEKIEFIAVWETGLKEIHQSDLSPFTKLRILSLWINDVEVIERDLLKFNPHLEYIGLGKNRIKFVDGNVFGHLNALHSLYIDDNKCISRQVAGNREAVADLLQEIQQKCSGSYGTAPAGDSNFEITCRYETETDWWAINNVYFCDLQYGVETLKLKDVITAVNGDHLDDRSNADVVGFRASKRRLEYFPKGLANYFDAEKIEFIAVWETGLKEIHQSDLSPFTKLRILSLWINDVEVIERDLLKFNPHLEYIGLGKNKIKFVDGNVFGHLNALHSLYIDDNKCISRQVADNREAVVDLLQEIQQKCSGSNGTAPGGDSNLELTCRYDTETDWWAIDDVYFCDLQYGVETLKLKDVVTAVNGDHLDDKSYGDVAGFRASKRRLEYFPKGLANYFDAEKIEFIAVWETGLKEIHQSDLSPFTKLRILSLWINDVEVIERDLLKFNPHLEYIGLGKNRIKFVDGNVFGHLNALHSLYIDDNKCISRQVAGNREAVADLLQEIQQKCSGSYGTAPAGDSNFEITCRYETETDWWAINNVYFCDLQYGVETLKLKDVITAVNGDHLDDKSNADVAGFRASKRRLEYFPKGLANYFDAEKIEFIAVWETGLKVIHQSDLSPFTKLRILSLWINDVEVIERDLLKFNPHLEYIGLGKNKIKFVDGNVFGHLNALHSLYIDDNKCISRQVADNREAVVDLLQEIQQKCSGYNGTAPRGHSNLDIRK